MEPARAGTRHDAADPGLRGRTYAIPFDRVWTAAIVLAGGKLRGWRIVFADDHNGVITAEYHSLLLRSAADVEIRIGLDEDAQTRVDATSASRRGGPDLGANARRLRRFLRALDRRLAQPR